MIKTSLHYFFIVLHKHYSTTFAICQVLFTNMRAMLCPSAASAPQTPPSKRRQRQTFRVSGNVSQVGAPAANCCKRATCRRLPSAKFAHRARALTARHGSTQTRRSRVAACRRHDALALPRAADSPAKPAHATTFRNRLISLTAYIIPQNLRFVKYFSQIYAFLCLNWYLPHVFAKRKRVAGRSVSCELPLTADVRAVCLHRQLPLHI